MNINNKLNAYLILEVDKKSGILAVKKVFFAQVCITPAEQPRAKTGAGDRIDSGVGRVGLV